jgi:hypothetical protein
VKAFAAKYVAAFEQYLLEPGEPTLHVAYELGRKAVAEQLSVLDLAIVHHDAMLGMLGAAQGAGDARATVTAGGEFFLESVSAFEMIQRGYREARDAAALERRHAETLRQLSEFLADASLALDASDSVLEILILVCEQARELIPADCCLVTMGRGRARADSKAPGDASWEAFVRWVDLAPIDELLRERPGPLRLSGAEISERLEIPGASDLPEPRLHGWLATSLNGLDGHHMGSIHLVNRSDGEFSGLDEAVIVHLAQISAAALERAAFYVGPPDRPAA